MERNLILACVDEQVPHELYENLLKADSKGRFMNEFIKGKFKYETM